MQADEIQKLRAKLGLTQEQLGERLGVSKAQVSKYESGKRNPGGAVKILLQRLANPRKSGGKR